MNKTMTKKLYAKRNPIEQGQHYMNHLMAMTAEDLHSKSAIAEELAHRDIVIENITKRLPCTHDGVPILWGDTVYYLDTVLIPLGEHKVSSITVKNISMGVDFADYNGTYTVGDGCYESGNLDFYSQQNLVPQD